MMHCQTARMSRKVDGRSLFWMVAAITIACLLSLTPSVVLAEAEGNNAPTNVACQGWERDTVIISWKDNDNDEQNYRIERSTDGAAFAEIVTVSPEANGKYKSHHDKGIDVSKNYRYRVRGAHSDGTFTSYGPICDNRRIFETSPGPSSGFRIFYGLAGTDDCPQIDGRAVCLTNTSSGGQNVFVTLLANALQGSVDAFKRVGFTRDAAVPNGGLDKIPVNVVWCDGGGCAGGSSLGLSPLLMEMAFNLTTRVGDPIAYLVAEHEAFHFQQFKYWGLKDPADGWVVEGQARSTQDKICVGATRSTANCFDDIATGFAGYVPEVNAYLGNANRSINRTGYQSALFWTYLTEKYGTSPASSDTVEGGMNLMVKFWEESRANPNRDGIAVLNSTLANLGHSDRFRDIWKNFAVANYAKNLTGSGVSGKYKYADMAQPGGNYRQVALTADEALSGTDSYLVTAETVYPWAAKYYVFRPDASVPVIDVKVKQDSNVPLYYTVLAVKNNGIAQEYNFEGRHLSRTILNNSYDRIVVVVAGLENLANYRVSVNGTQPVLNILSPTTSNKARVGSATTPDKFRLAVEVLAPDGTPLTGVNLADFNISIGGTSVPATNILTSAHVQGQQWFIVRALSQTVPPNQYDLTVDYGGSTVLTDTESLAIDYSPRTDADSMLIIDRSGSMSGNKLDAAQNAAQLYVDSWHSGDKLGVVSYHHTPTRDMSLVDWTDAPSGGTRQQAFTAINGLSASGGTNIGDSLMMGFDELKANGNAAHDWALVLLSDGKEEASSPTVNFSKAINNISTATGKKPVIHAVAIGPNADGPKMQEAANRTGGTYQFVSEPVVAAAGAAGVTAISNPRLDLDARYRYIATAITGQQQSMTLVGPLNDGDPLQDKVTIPVEGSVSELNFSLSFDGTCACEVILFDPHGNRVPPHQRTSRHIVWRENLPDPGDWTLVLRLPSNIITFEEYPEDEQISGQYLESHATGFEVGGVIIVPKEGTSSGQQALEAYKDVGQIYIYFQEPQTSVRMKVGVNQTTDHNNYIVIEALDGSGSAVDDDWTELGQGPMPITTPLAVSSAKPNIYAVRVTHDGGLPVIDDVELGGIGAACVGECVSAQAVTELLPAYLVQAAVKSDVQLLAALTTPLEERTSGVSMPIIASLTDSKPILGAHVEATINAPYGRIHHLILHDDGNHGDGAPDDGVYGNIFYQTGAAGTSSGAGSYNITVDAEGTSSLGDRFTRQQILGFFILGSGDDDDDRLPNEYEERYAGKDNITGLDPNKDPDNDGRTTGEEFEDGTDPLNPDSDNGGESDGSEKEHGTDPYNPDDDGVPSTWAVAYPGIGETFIRYAPNSKYVLVQVVRSESPDGPYSLAGEDDGESGMIVDSDVENDKEYCYYAVGVTADGHRSAQRLPSCTMPKADPWAPDGAVLINGGAATTTSRDVTLNLYASDEVSPHVDTPDELDDRMTPPVSSATGVSEMRIGNEADLADGSWQPFAATLPWTLAQGEGLAMVYVQFKDGAGNVSRIIPAGILFGEGAGNKYRIMLPMIMQ